MNKQNESATENLELLKKRLERMAQQSKRLQKKCEDFSSNHLSYEEIAWGDLQLICSNSALWDIKKEMDTLYETYYLIDILQNKLKNIANSTEKNEKNEVKSSSFLPNSDPEKSKNEEKSTSFLPNFDTEKLKNEENASSFLPNFDTKKLKNEENASSFLPNFDTEKLKNEVKATPFLPNFDTKKLKNEENASSFLPNFDTEKLKNEKNASSFLPNSDTEKLKNGIKATSFLPNFDTEKSKNKEKTKKLSGNRLEIYLEPDFFIVKTPHLLSINNKKPNSLHNYFSEILKNEIKEILKNHRIFLNQFAPKHITVLQNHHCQEWKIADNNNLDTKKIVDAICEFCNGDAALTTSFSLVASRNFLIQDACYFIVTKGYLNVKTMEKYQEILEKLYPKKGAYN